MILWRILQIARSLLSYVLGGILIVLLVFPCALLILLMPKRYVKQRGVIHNVLYYIYAGAVRCMLMPVYFYHTKRIPDEPAIIVGNHQSSLDIPVTGMLLQGAPHLWYALSYYARHPIFGVFVRGIGISVDVKKDRLSARSLLQGVRILDDDPRHVIIFPEGGRYPGKQVRSFYRGFAMLARKTHRPVVPVYMPHNGVIYHPHAYLTQWHPIVAHVGHPLYPREEESDEVFVQRVRQWFLEQAEEWT